MTKRILIAVPTAPNGVHPLTLKSLMALAWGGELDYLILRCDKPQRAHYDDLAYKLNTAREWALLGDYDALLIVEADMVVPPYALQRLVKVRGADIVYGLYCSRRGQHPWLAFNALNPDTPMAHDGWGKAVKSAGVGTGCTLIRRKALEQLIFRAEAGGQAPDYYMALDAAEAGLRQKHDLGVVCGHILSADPLRIVWPAEDGHYIEEPDADAREMMAYMATAGRYTALKPLTFTLENRTVQPGEIVELNAAQAALFLRRGIVEPCQEED